MSTNGERPQKPGPPRAGGAPVPWWAALLVGLAIAAVAFLARWLTGTGKEWLLDLAEGSRLRAWLIGSAVLVAVAVLGRLLGWWGVARPPAPPDDEADDEAADGPK
jgi:hypothetical protein